VTRIRLVFSGVRWFHLPILMAGLAAFVWHTVVVSPDHTAAHLRSLGYSNVLLDVQNTRSCGRGFTTGYPFEAVSASGKFVTGRVCASITGYFISEQIVH
jgi:hypothetical protein